MATKQNRTQQYRINSGVHVNLNVLEGCYQESNSAICDEIPWSLVEWVNSVYCNHVYASQVPQHCWWCVLFIAQPALWLKYTIVEPVCNDHLYDKIYYLWFIQ